MLVTTEDTIEAAEVTSYKQETGYTDANTFSQSGKFPCQAKGYIS